MKTNIRSKVSKNIRKLRLSIGYTQEELSEKANIDYKYLQKIEGKNPPNFKLDTIDKLARALKTTAADLLTYTL